MDNNRDIRLLRELDRLAIVASAVGVVILTGIYFMLAAIEKPAEGGILLAAREFGLSIIPNLIAVLLISLVSYLLFRRIQTIKSEHEDETLASRIVSEVRAVFPLDVSGSTSSASNYYEEFGQVAWDELLLTCSSLDICVHYFDTWINDNSQLIQQLFNRGGVIRLVIPNYKNDSIVRTIKRRFPDYSEEQVKSKIQNTQAKLKMLLEKSSHRDARLEAYYVDEVLFYCGVRFDRRTLVLSVYEHIREMRIAAPAVVINLARYNQSQDWFEKEFSGLIDVSVEQITLGGRHHR